MLKDMDVPSPFNKLMGGQIANRLQRALEDHVTNWDRVNSDPLGKDSLDLTRAQNPFNLRKGIDRYPLDLWKTVQQKIDKVADFTSDPQERK